ncbi:MAG TPA: outer membrane beta-barrel protein [Flavobacterium sp.]|nr:outer membrane beta-barrel protein [Flavobacterium sp.]
MKKLLLILALAVFSFANAQKGAVLVLGNVGYSSQKSDVSMGISPTQKSFNFSPKVGYQYNDNWTVGVESYISNSKQTYTSGEYKNNNFSVGGFLRYSKPIGGIFSAYADLGAGYHNVKQTQYNGGINPYLSTLNGNGFYVGVTPALLLNINKGFGLNFNLGSIGYSTLNYSNPANDTQNFNFSFGQTFSIGISKNF